MEPTGEYVNERMRDDAKCIVSPLANRQLVHGIVSGEWACTPPQRAEQYTCKKSLDPVGISTTGN
jgi:hypothetical protein